MSDEGAQAEQAQGQQQRIQLSDSIITTKYANFFTISGGQDAILFTFGNQFGGQGRVQLNDKIVLSPRNAKRLAISLGQVIRRYEEQNGEIEIQQPGQQQQGEEGGQ